MQLNLYLHLFLSATFWVETVSHVLTLILIPQSKPTILNNPMIILSCIAKYTSQKF